MKVAHLAFAVVACGLFAISFGLPFDAERDPREQFVRFQQQYGKTYETQEEFDSRFRVFAANLKRAEELNAKSSNATFGVTRFMDLAPEEFVQRMLMPDLPPVERDNADVARLMPQAPSAFDWRSKRGVVTPVYNQEQCGSCWAFSATENIESQWALAGHPLTKLSMQQIVDCDSGDYGCNGGWTYNAYQYVIHAGGLDSLADYPYTAETGYCEFRASEVAARIASWIYVTQSKDESQMANYLYAKGPVSVCVDAEAWQFYTSGVLTADQCGRSIDHCVLAVGYDLAASVPYWSIRNSWGADWGEQGYIRIQYGRNACAVAEVATSAVVK